MSLINGVFATQIAERDLKWKRANSHDMGNKSDRIARCFTHIYQDYRAESMIGVLDDKSLQNDTRSFVVDDQATDTTKKKELDEVKQQIEETEFKLTQLSLLGAKESRQKILEQEVNSCALEKLQRSPQARDIINGKIEFESPALSREDVEAIEAEVQCEKLRLFKKLKELQAEKEVILATYFCHEPRFEFPTSEDSGSPAHVPSVSDIATRSQTSYLGLLFGYFGRTISKSENLSIEEKQRLENEINTLRASLTTLQQIPKVLMCLLCNDSEASFKVTEFFKQIKDTCGENHETHLDFLTLVAGLVVMLTELSELERASQNREAMLTEANKKIDFLGRRIKLMAPLFDVGKAVRLGHLETVKRIRYDGQFIKLRGTPNRQIIDERNAVAHNGNPMADFSLMTFCKLALTELDLLRDMYRMPILVSRTFCESLLNFIPCDNWKETAATHGTMFSCYAETSFTHSKTEEVKFKGLHKELLDLFSKYCKESCPEDAPIDASKPAPTGAVLKNTLKKVEEDPVVKKNLEEMRKIADNFSKLERRRLRANDDF
ncbi:hypothetical protein HYALB_00010563 [Hymenoscyphus albidus]|uniref:Uncharacterized protein n=1 Tax=Hymenoscyphus albidus TaxID=595503 RepID=A0A9N9LH36_9HELO|nr:hypothetical protein HYALB_00010563 [Hymenoscyphus albidus]